jgi:hypothetical protein
VKDVVGAISDVDLARVATPITGAQPMSLVAIGRLSDEAHPKENRDE